MCEWLYILFLSFSISRNDRDGGEGKDWEKETGTRVGSRASLGACVCVDRCVCGFRSSGGVACKEEGHNLEGDQQEKEKEKICGG